MGLGGIYRKKSEFKKALDNYNFCLEINPYNLPVLNEVGMILALQQKYD